MILVLSGKVLSPCRKVLGHRFWRYAIATSYRIHSTALSDDKICFACDRDTTPHQLCLANCIAFSIPSLCFEPAIQLPEQSTPVQMSLQASCHNAATLRTRKHQLPGASRTPATGTNLAAPEAQNRSEYQQENIAQDFGIFFGDLPICLAGLLIP